MRAIGIWNGFSGLPWVSPKIKDPPCSHAARTATNMNMTTHVGWRYSPQQKLFKCVVSGILTLRCTRDTWGTKLHFGRGSKSLNTAAYRCNGGLLVCCINVSSILDHCFCNIRGCAVVPRPFLGWGAMNRSFNRSQIPSDPNMRKSMPSPIESLYT